jgi:RNA recognition motif-containing protein
MFQDEAVPGNRPVYGGDRQGGFSRGGDRGSGGFSGGDRRGGGHRSNFKEPNREPPSPKESIYVGNLYFEVKAEDLKNLFEKFGTVLEARIVADQRGMSRG